MKSLTIILAAALPMLTVAADDVAKFDLNMAVATAPVDTNGVRWIDGKLLPIEGKAFTDTEFYYDRLPKNVTTNVNGGVRSMKHHSAGMQFRFATDSDFLVIDMRVRGTYSGSDNLCAVGRCGWDVYRFDEKLGRWQYDYSSHRSTFSENRKRLVKRIPWIRGEKCLINLPSYEGVADFRLGIAGKATLTRLPVRKSGVTKPVVFYGTSITHGASASRPGLAFVNIVGRELDVPVVNLGFSGSGVMEYEMSEHLAKIDASCYVLDCIWNMGSLKGSVISGRNVEENYEPFIRNLRTKRPDVPIVMAEASSVKHDANHMNQNRAMRTIYEKLMAEGWQKLIYLPRDNMYDNSCEGTVDNVHPNDLGMVQHAAAYGGAVRLALGL